MIRVDYRQSPAASWVSLLHHGGGMFKSPFNLTLIIMAGLFVHSVEFWGMAYGQWYQLGSSRRFGNE